MKNLKRILPLLLALIMVFTVVAGSTAFAAPTTVKIICPYGAGGIADLVGRKYAEVANKVQDKYTFVVENMTGGDGFAANIFLYPIGKALTRAVAKIIQVRYTYLACAIIMFCFAGAFAASGHYKELILTAAILIFSYILTILDIDNTPLLLGMILEPIMEKYFVSASMSYDRDYTIFVRRPISLVILLITVVMVFSMMRVNRRVNKLNAEQEAAMAAEHAELKSDADAQRAVQEAEKATEGSFESAIAGAVFEREHVKSNPDKDISQEK